MNQARKSNFKTHVEKLNPTPRTDLSNKTLHSILYWKLLFKPFPYKSFGWCNAHSVQADALWGRSFKFQMKNTPQNQYFPANAERMDVHCLESGCIGKYIPLGPRDFPRAWILHPSALEISLGLRPREISRASGCKIPALHPDPDCAALRNSFFKGSFFGTKRQLRGSSHTQGLFSNSFGSVSLRGSALFHISRWIRLASSTSKLK